MCTDNTKQGCPDQGDGEQAGYPGEQVPVARDVVVDLCAGRQSMRGPAKRSGYRYVAVELLAVVEALGGKREAQVVLDITTVEPEELLRVIAAQAGITQEEILFIIMGISAMHDIGVDRLKQPAAGIHVAQGLFEA